jgi:hypothetical protein
MKMKREILNFDGIRQFTATISHYGNLDNPDKISTCLTNIQDANGKQIVDHLWFKINIKPVRPASNNIGKVVSFFAKSSMYFYGDQTSDRGSYDLRIVGNMYVATRFHDGRGKREASYFRYLLRKNRNRYVIIKLKNGIPAFFSYTKSGNPQWGKNSVKFYDSEHEAIERKRWFKYPNEKHVFKFLVYDNHIYLGIKSNQFHGI